jgi:hypothetical protein
MSSRARVFEGDDAGGERLGVLMAHAAHLDDVAEQLLAASRDDRVRDEVVLVDDSSLDGRSGGRRSAPEDDVAAGLLLQVSNSVDTAGEDRGVRPLDLAQRA